MPTTLTHDPVTRVGGGLGVHVEMDDGLITDAYVAGTQFRGYEPILTGRDPRDSMLVSSRACGWCGGVHATTASLALEMAWGLPTPPMATSLRTIAQATEAIWVHAAHLAVRAGPDYCAPVVRATTPWVWKEAQSTEAPNAGVHGYGTMADIMEAMTPVTGGYWYHTIPVGRSVLEMVNLMYGKYPHPSTVSPGGVGSTLTIGNFTEFYTRLYQAVDYVKRVITMWDDLCDFLPQADPRFARLGERPASFVHAGCWDDAETYDASYAGMDEWANRRLARPGVVVDGELVTGALSEVGRGITEEVDHSFYDDTWSPSADPSGQALPDRHPWGRTTVARPGRRSFGGSYSWCTAPRWNGHTLESTALGRLWLAATDPRFPANDFIEPTGDSVRILVPLHMMPEMIVEWHVPERVNALERLRADAYGIAFAGLCSAIALLKGFELLRQGRTAVSSSFKVDKGEVAAAGLWESGRGINAHWMRTEGGSITTYQITNASTWNASPRDASGQPGPIEQALIGSPVLEEPQNGRLKGIDTLRVVHSFDPCMTCGVH